jgi:hypothetical protein
LFNGGFNRGSVAGQAPLLLLLYNSTISEAHHAYHRKVIPRIITSAPTMLKTSYPYAWIFCSFATLGAWIYGYDGVYFTGVSALGECARGLTAEANSHRHLRRQLWYSSVRWKLCNIRFQLVNDDIHDQR